MAYKKLLFGFGILNSVLLFFLILCYVDNHDHCKNATHDSPNVKLLTCLNLLQHPTPISSFNSTLEPKEPNKISPRNFALLIISGISLLPFVLFISVVGKKFKKYRKRQNELIHINKNKDLFFSILSHDLKSPALNLISLSELASKNKKYLSEEEADKINDIMYSSAVKHYDLLCNLLDWSKTQFSGTPVIKNSYNLYELIEENIISQTEKSREKGISIYNDIDKNININTNENMLNTIIRNILHNAIKFTQQNGEIYFYCKVQKNSIDIFIEDDGIGMNEKTLKHLFDLKYIRSLRGTNKEIGTGIGLILCKEVLTKLKGKIKVLSREKEGSIFIISLPL